MIKGIWVLVTIRLQELMKEIEAEVMVPKTHGQIVKRVCQIGSLLRSAVPTRCSNLQQRHVEHVTELSLLFVCRKL